MKIFIDIETGGFSITKNGVCEIAFVVTDNELNKLFEYQSLIKPYPRDGTGELVSYKPDAMAVNKILIEDLHAKGKDVTEVCENILKAIQEFAVTTIIGHNSIVFDVPRIDHLLGRFHGKTIKHLFQIDTMQTAKIKHSLPSYSLENLCTHFGIVNESAHSALSDVYATIELYKKLR